MGGLDRNAADLHDFTSENGGLIGLERSSTVAGRRRQVSRHPGDGSRLGTDLFL